jgi:anti-sigma B factor antagonist
MMQVSTEQNGSVSVVAVKGDVDLNSSRELQTELREALGSGPSRLVVDLSGVPYMDSSGVATLVEAMQLSRKKGTKLVLCAMGDKVQSIFEIARLDKVFTIVNDRAEAESV